MSRMNNTGRSLQIVSQQNGWDPNHIEDRTGNLGKQGPPIQSDIKDVYHARENLNRSDTGPIPDCAKDGQAMRADPGMESQDWLSPKNKKDQDHGSGGDPFAGMGKF